MQFILDEKDLGPYALITWTGLRQEVSTEN